MEHLKSAMGYGKTSPNLKKAMVRLEKDRQELTESPVPNVSAAPLDDNMLEWHCNIQHGGNIFHLILFFPAEYPCVSPSAEFVPTGFEYRGGAYMNGRKGTKICLSIFSDFAKYHTEWKDEKNTGWSPGYTVQTVLLNVVSFLSDLEMGDANANQRYINMCQRYRCKDCGHTFNEPSPALVTTELSKTAGGKEIPRSDLIAKEDQEARCSPDNRTDDPLQALLSRIVDYMSKETFSLKKPASNDHLFGYGIIVSGSPKHPQLTSPCEFLTLASFKDMASSLGQAQSVHREKLNFFLPLYITDDHGSTIRHQFEETMMKMADVVFPDLPSKSLSDVILKVIPNLMCSTVVQFSKGTVHTSDNSLEGYFALHRLFMWAMDTYPELVRNVNSKLEDFVNNKQFRNKTYCPDIGQWLMLLSVTGKYQWEHVAEAYLSENFLRNVMWYTKAEKKLADMNTPMQYRLQRTFELTQVGRNLLAFQVAFLQIAKPKDMSRGDVLRRYAANLGFATSEMVRQLKVTFTKINKDVTRYDHWYRAIGLAPPTQQQLHEKLKASVSTANATRGYFFSDVNNRNANGSAKHRR